MARKTFNTYRKTETPEFDIQDPEGVTTTFRMKPSVPGAVLLDFLSGANADDPAAMARTVNSLLVSSIHEDDLEKWQDYIHNPRNEVTLDVLSEIAGYASEVLSGGNDQPSQSLNG